jgi:hypothetical protein
VSAEVGTLVEIVDCPSCALPAEVEDSSMLDSTDGPIEHLKVRCVADHRFLLPRSDVT